MRSALVQAMGRHIRKMPPTQKHRPVLTPGILGTVYGVSPEGEVRYFDYDWDAALQFAGVTLENVSDLDLRFGKAARPRYLPGWDMWHPERKVDGKAWWAL